MHRVYTLHICDCWWTVTVIRGRCCSVHTDTPRIKHLLTVFSDTLALSQGAFSVICYYATLYKPPTVSRVPLFAACASEAELQPSSTSTWLIREKHLYDPVCAWCWVCMFYLEINTSEPYDTLILPTQLENQRGGGGRYQLFWVIFLAKMPKFNGSSFSSVKKCFVFAYINILRQQLQ